MDERHEHKVFIVGCGPGLKAYIPSKALYAIKKAEILVGSRQLLELFPNTGAEKVLLEKNYHVLISKIANWRFTKRVVVLVSGDPCFFSYAKMILNGLGKNSCEIIPGISSMQMAFAAIGETWEDACFISLHGRNMQTAQFIEKVIFNKKVGILTDAKNTPAVIAGWLLQHRIANKKMFICENLSLPGQRIFETTLDSAMDIRTSGTTVVILKNDNG